MNKRKVVLFSLIGVVFLGYICKLSLFRKE